MKTALIALWGLISWLAVECLIFMPLCLAGALAMPVLLRWAPIIKKESRINAGQQIDVFAWPWAQDLWGNWEDGLCPPWWCDVCLVHAPTRASRMSWYMRNPVCNMRFWPWISTLPSPTVQWVGTLREVPDTWTPGWFLAWQGAYVGFRWQCASWGLWLGWKLNPRDARYLDPADYRRYGLGTACQLLRR